MGQYKVPQNVETEDKILGPLSVKQFIYVIIGILWAFLMWRLFSFAIILAVVFALPVTGFFLLLGFGQREGVPFEDYVVAFFRYLTVPRKRIWMKDQSKDVLVEAQVQKPIEAGPKQVSVGQLKQLAAIIDTRGSFKDASIQYSEDAGAAEQYSRVIGPSSVSASGPVGIATQSATAQDDILDDANQRSAQVSTLLQNAETTAREQAVASVARALHSPVQPAQATIAPQPAVNPAAAVIARQGNNLPVNVLAARASRQLAAGQSVDLRTPQAIAIPKTK